MAKTTEIVVVEDTQAQPPKPQPPHLPNLFAFFPKFNLQLPFLNPPKPKPKHGDSPNNVAVPVPVPVPVPVADDQGKGKQQEEGPAKPSFVRFPKTQVVAPPPLEAEAEESGTKTSNPLIIWQVYALGAFFISRWIWARWNERKAQGRPPNDDRAEGRNSDDGRRSSDDGNN